VRGLVDAPDVIVSIWPIGGLICAAGGLCDEELTDKRAEKVAQLADDLALVGKLLLGGERVTLALRLGVGGLALSAQGLDLLGREDERLKCVEPVVLLLALGREVERSRLAREAVEHLAHGAGRRKEGQLREFDEVVAVEGGGRDNLSEDVVGVGSGGHEAVDCRLVGGLLGLGVVLADHERSRVCGEWGDGAEPEGRRGIHC